METLFKIPYLRSKIFEHFKNSYDNYDNIINPFQYLSVSPALCANASFPYVDRRRPSRVCVSP